MAKPILDLHQLLYASLYSIQTVVVHMMCLWVCFDRFFVHSLLFDLNPTLQQSSIFTAVIFDI